MSITSTYDAESDALLVRFGEGRHMARTIVVAPGVHLDVDQAGRLVSLEVIGASGKVSADALAGLDDGTEWLSLSEAADLADLSPTTLRVQIHNGRIAGEKRGRDWVVARHVLDTYLDEVEQQQTGRAPPRTERSATIAKGSARNYTVMTHIGLGRIVQVEKDQSSGMRVSRGGGFMAKNEKSSGKVAKLAGKVLGGQKATAKQVKSLAGSVLTQAPDKPKKKGK